MRYRRFAGTSLNATPSPIMAFRKFSPTGNPPRDAPMYRGNRGTPRPWEHEFTGGLPSEGR